MVEYAMEFTKALMMFIFSHFVCLARISSTDEMKKGGHQQERSSPSPDCDWCEGMANLDELRAHEQGLPSMVFSSSTAQVPLQTFPNSDYDYGDYDESFHHGFSSALLTRDDFAGSAPERQTAREVLLPADPSPDCHPECQDTTKRPVRRPTFLPHPDDYLTSDGIVATIIMLTMTGIPCILACTVAMLKCWTLIMQRNDPPPQAIPAPGLPAPAGAR